MNATSSPRPSRLSLAGRQRLEAGLARRVLAPLEAADLPHDIEQRLRFARERALAQARHTQAAASQPWVQVGKTLVIGAPWWQKAASFLPLLLLVAGLVLIQSVKNDIQVDAAAEIDSVLLADELPPDAYADPGFGEFLRRPVE